MVIAHDRRDRPRAQRGAEGVKLIVRRSPWIDQRATQLVNLLLTRYGYTITEDVAREDISHQVDLIAERMRIGQQAAKRHVTAEYIADFADHVADVIDRHNDAVRKGEVSDLSAKRRQRFPKLLDTD